MIWTPYAPDRLVDTLHRLRDTPILLPTCIPQQLCLLQDLFLLKVPHTHGLLAAVDIVANDYGMSVSRTDSYFDLRVCRGELLEGVFKEGA